MLRVCMIGFNPNIDPSKKTVSKILGIVYTIQVEAYNDYSIYVYDYFYSHPTVSTSTTYGSLPIRLVVYLRETRVQYIFTCYNYLW